MAFRLCKAPTTFSCLMDVTLTGLTWEICLAYLDDVTVFRDWPCHLQCLWWVFTRLHQAGLKLNPDNYVHVGTHFGLPPKARHVHKGDPTRPSPAVCSQGDHASHRCQGTPELPASRQLLLLVCFQVFEKAGSPTSSSRRTILGPGPRSARQHSRGSNCSCYV